MGKADAFTPQTAGASQLYKLPVTDLTTDKAKLNFRILPAFRETPLSEVSRNRVLVTGVRVYRVPLSLRSVCLFCHDENDY
jgi:hypothetical protein